MKNVVCKLLNIVNHGNRENADFSLAMGLLKNLDTVANTSIEQMAEQCYTSTASLSRLCRKLGYQNYAQFKQQFDRPVSSLLLSTDHRAIYTPHLSEQRTIERIIDREMECLAQLKEQIKREQLERIIDEIFRANTIYLICEQNRPDIIFDFQYKMLLANKYIDYRGNKWIQSYSTDPWSLRIHINLLTVESYESLHSDRIGISIADRVNKPDKRLVDIKIILTDPLPVISSDTTRKMDDGKYGPFLLQTLLNIVSVAYAEKYVLSKRVGRS